MADWHPIMDAQEYEPGRWVIFDVRERPYALVDFVRRGPELGYRATRWAQDGDGALIGYYRTLRAACAAVNLAKNNEGVPHGHPTDAYMKAPAKANTPARTERD
ncbi:MAG: hypothetical protein JWP85_2147 [Rhodoglobus sp.]|nr:hypothetical protein [Rhodoglobus sp.]